MSSTLPFLVSSACIWNRWLRTYCELWTFVARSCWGVAYVALRSRSLSSLFSLETNHQSPNHLLQTVISKALRDALRRWASLLQRSQTDMRRRWHLCSCWGENLHIISSIIARERDSLLIVIIASHDIAAALIISSSPVPSTLKGDWDGPACWPWSLLRHRIRK